MLANINYTPLWLGSSLFAVSLMSHAGTYTPDNVTSNQLISGIYSITTQQTGAIPTIRVQSNGNTYTSVKPGQNIKYQGKSRGVCRSKRKIRKFTWWINDNSHTGPASFYQKHKKLVNKNWISSKSKKDKHEVAGQMSLSIPSKVAQDAVKACNNYLQKEKGKGKSIQSILSKNHTIKSNQHKHKRMAAVTYLQCSNNNGMNTKRAHAWQNIRVDYICEDFNFPKPKPASMANLAMPFLLEKPKISVTPKNYNGSCPVDIKVSGTLKANIGQKK